MIEKRIVRRYATALFKAAKDEGVIDRIESDLGLVAYVIEMSPELMNTIKSPVVPKDVKKNIVKSVANDRLHPITLNYLYLLIDKGREEAILDTEQEYLDLANEERGVVTAQVVTAIKLDEEQENLLKEKLKKMTGKNIHLVKVAIPEVLGGVLIRIGDRVIDGTIRGQLDKMKENLK
ncbi:MAG: ATP synthase F1 subunit delta [Armatimonadota bacterium]